MVQRRGLRCDRSRSTRLHTMARVDGDASLGAEQRRGRDAGVCAAAQGSTQRDMAASGLNRANALHCLASLLLKKLGRSASALTSQAASP